MVKVLVMSDTHLRRPEDLPAIIIKKAKDADLIIHAGDITHKDVLQALTGLSDVAVVRGNMDQASFSAHLPERRTIDIEGVRIGIIHGSGSPNQVIHKARAAFEEVDIIVFGHSHIPVLDKWFGTAMLNPGSPTDPRFAPYPSFGWIEINQGAFQASIISTNGSIKKSLKG